MVLSDFSIRRPVAMVVILIALMCLGLLALKKLRVNPNPDVEQPVLVINIAYPGASPDSVEREVINRIEKPLQSISGVYQMRSTASEGNASIVVIFDFKKNMIEAADEVRNAIAGVRYKLPVEMREPNLRRVDPAAQPVMQMALSSSTLSHAEASRLAEDEIAPRFRTIAGVAVVNVNGALKRELSILLHQQKLREYGITVTEVVAAVRGQNTTAPVGRVVGPLQEQSIRLVGRVESPAEFAQVVVRRRGAEIVRLGDIGTIQDGFAEVTGHSLRNGNPNVGINVVRAREASTVSVANEVRAEVAAINKTLPAGTRMEITQDGGEDAQSNLNNVIEALVFGAILTAFVVYVFLNSWRSTLITALSLPTSVIAAFIAVWACGFTLNFMTLLGLSLAIGVLIDDAIVVRENIMRHLAMGQDRITAAREGTSEIGLAVMATTFSIIAVFIPVAFMGGVAGEWFRPFALTVASSVLVSLFISFTLDPMLSAYWGDPQAEHGVQRGRIGRALERFNTWFDHQAERYTRVVSWALDHRRSLTALTIAALVGSLALHMKFGGSSFLPASDGNTLAIEVRTPSSASLDYALRKVEAAAAIARALPEAVATNSSVNPAGGRVYVDIGKSTKRKRTAAAVAADLRQSLRQLVGAEYVVFDELNNGVRKPVQVQFSGADYRQLLALVEDYMAQLSQVPGAVDVGLSEQPPKDELRIDVQRGLASTLGVSVSDIAQSLRVAFAGLEVGDWIDPTGEARDVAVRLRPQDRVSVDHLENLPVATSASGAPVPLGQVASITLGKGPAQIQHVDGKRMITVSANVEKRSAGEVTQDALAIAKRMNFPPGYSLALGGAARDQKELFTEMTIALFLGIGLMYLILVMQFGSFTAPISVMMSLPLSLIGVVLALLVTGGTLNLMSFIGIIMLMGLVAKNAILLLDCARAREAQGMSRHDALVEAGRLRLRPILMTTFALIAGMLPVAIGHGEGGEFYRPLAVAIIGGTITSTLLTLLVVPTFYDSIETSRERWRARWQRLSARWSRA